MRERTTDGNSERAQPFALTWELSEEFKRGFSFQMVPSSVPLLERAHGFIEAYVCRACGATELFTRDAASIPIGPEYGTELIVAPGDVYR